MSLAAGRDGLALTLAACGPWSASEISACSFDVVTNTAGGGCAITLLPGPQAVFEPESLGDGRALNYRNEWLIHGTLYLQDSGDSAAILARVWQAHDDLRATIAKDATLQGALGENGAARLTRIAFNERLALKMAGRVFAPVEFWVSIMEI